MQDVWLITPRARWAHRGRVWPHSARSA